MMLRRFRLISICLIFVVHLLSVRAQSQDAVVYGVMFYSQDCGHCRELIENQWPPIQTAFGNRLRVLFINIDDKQGIQIKRDVEAALGIPSPGVPMLVIGSQVMAGSHIAERAPAVIRAGLAAGGIDFPAIEGVRERYQEAVAQAEQGDLESAPVFGLAATPNQPLAERLAADPIANMVSIFVLVLLLFSLLLFGAAGWRHKIRHDQRLLVALSGRTSRVMLLLLSCLGLGLAVSLLAGWSQQWPILLLAGGEGAVFITCFVIVCRRPPVQPLSAWLVPLLALAGLAAAGYLMSVEVTATEAVCGVVGSCNSVQQSPYARIFGVPVALWGMVAYGGILLIWWLGSRHAWSERALLGMSVLGTAFSAYLTFLEPFVIGASCGWCLTSAVLMLMLLWAIIARRGIYRRTPQESTLSQSR